MFKNLFKRSTIKVRLIEAISNETFNEVQLKKEQLPESFDKPTTIRIEDDEWQVVKAEPQHASEFSKSGSLTLWVKPVLKFNPAAIRYSIPTISNELPATTSDYFYNDFTLALHEDDWRQIEFLPCSLLGIIQEEMGEVEKILFPVDQPDFESLNGFEKMHVRSKIGQKHLSISIEDFCESLQIKERGSITLTNYVENIENGFALRSSNFTYYGIVEKGMIKELCLKDLDGLEDEILQVMEKYQIALVAWCRGSITNA
jgi:hypothetical protein